MANASELGEWDLDNPDLYLNPNETGLLINALNSNKPAGTTNKRQQDSSYIEDGLDTSLNSNPYLDFDTSSGFDWDLKAMSTNPEGYPTYPPNPRKKSSEGSDDGSDKDSPEYDDGELGDKRKADSPEGDDGSGKRQETGKKSQRPGRKPLTSEPTTKRKAQNRAAQRAFRERKEKHLKDLEDKVEELQKKSDSTTSENALLKAQVDRLQTELTEYRKRISSTPQSSTVGTYPSARNSWDPSVNFNFEFPKFGKDAKSDKVRSPTGQNLVQSPVASTSTRSNSQGTLSNDLKGLFSADILSGAQRAGTESASRHGASRSNSSNLHHFSPSNTASPASSGFNGFTSSCVTTPEPTTDAAEARKSTDTGNQTGNRKSFCDDFQNACGNTQNPVPRNPTSQTSTSSNDAPALTPGGLTTTSTNASLDLGFDWLANQNGGNFDPVLFGDYREPQESIMSGDAWFFNDAFQLPDLENPVPQQAQTQPTIPKKTFMQEIEDAQSGKEPEVVPGDAPQFLTCNLLWDRVQKSSKVVSGEADMDDLCSQLKAKAKCSGSGAVISTSDVDRILGPASHKDIEPNYLAMFK